MMMNKWVKRKWVRALRSGEYAQADGCLVDGGMGDASYCCLGVLLAEMRPESLDVETAKYSTVEYLVVKASEKMPDKDLVADDLAILWGVDYSTQEKLGDMNDTGNSFPVIADWIEKNL